MDDLGESSMNSWQFSIAMEILCGAHLGNDLLDLMECPWLSYVRLLEGWIKNMIPVVTRKAVAEVSMRGRL